MAQLYAKRSQMMAFSRLGRGVHQLKCDFVLFVLAITQFFKHLGELWSVEKVSPDDYSLLFFFLIHNFFLEELSIKPF